MSLEEKDKQLLIDLIDEKIGKTKYVIENKKLKSHAEKFLRTKIQTLTELMDKVEDIEV